MITQFMNQFIETCPFVDQRAWLNNGAIRSVFLFFVSEKNCEMQGDLNLSNGQNKLIEPSYLGKTSSVVLVRIKNKKERISFTKFYLTIYMWFFIRITPDLE